MVNKVALWQVFLRVLRYSIIGIISQLLSTLKHAHPTHTARNSGSMDKKTHNRHDPRGMLACRTRCGGMMPVGGVTGLLLAGVKRTAAAAR